MPSRIYIASPAPRHDRRPAHPPGLKGKDIGLYYRDRAKAKAKTKVNVPVLKFSPHIEQKMKTILKHSETFYNVASSESTTSDCDKYQYISDSQFKRKFLAIINGDIQQNLAKAISMGCKLQRNSKMDELLLNEYQEKQDQCDYQAMLKFRLKLPACRKKPEILQLIRDNQVVVISGETGKMFLLIDI